MPIKKTRQRCVVIHPIIAGGKDSIRSSLDRLHEAVALALALDLDIATKQVVNLKHIIPPTFLGKGKVAELENVVQDKQVDLVVINNQISPIQQRNLERSLNCKVIDRTALIIEIFAKRAKTKEGKLQVELAAYEYQKSRLVRSWTHLERQRGGGGFIGGPGETQIESDRRVISERIEVIKRQLAKVVKTRKLHRKARQKIPYPIISLVGYTNAGKSTLFNLITGAVTLVQDKLFATLDPTMRLVRLPSGEKVIFSDTVGFISELPTQLVAAFRATLEEVVEADIILHVRDISHHETKEQKKDVLAILEELVPQTTIKNNLIEVLNKTDLLDRRAIAVINKKTDNIVLTSALKETGIDKLLDLIDKKLTQGKILTTIKVNKLDSKQMAWLHEHAQILRKTSHKNNDYVSIKLAISKANLGKLRKRFPGDL